MAKKKDRIGLLVVGEVDLFDGFDLFDTGLQNVVVSDDPPNADLPEEFILNEAMLTSTSLDQVLRFELPVVTLPTPIVRASGPSEIGVVDFTDTEVPEVNLLPTILRMSDLAETRQVDLTEAEVSLDDLFGTETGTESIAALLSELPAPLTIETSDVSTVAVNQVPDELVLPAAPAPAWSERQFLASQISRDLAVTLHKVGRKAVAAIPHNLTTAAMLANYKELDQMGYAYGPADPELAVVAPRKAASDCRLLFPIAAVLNSVDIADSKLVGHLKGIGLEVGVSPSLENWVVREVRRRERELTPFDLPIIQDTRPMYDRMETGLVLTCKQSKGAFVAGTEYVVVETDNLNEEAGETDENKSEKGAVGLKKRGVDLGKPTFWGELDGAMEDYFTLAADSAQAFDPQAVFTKTHPELYNAALARIKKQKLPVFDYIQDDIAQAVYYRHLIFTHPPRMGKTSALVQYAEAAGTRKGLFVTVSNGVDVFAKELERMGFTDYVVPKTLKDLEKPGKYFLTSFNWLKSTGRQKDKDEQERLGVLNLCPHCNSTLMRPSRIQVKDPLTKKGLLDENDRPVLTFEYKIDESKKVLVWTDRYGYACKNAACTYSSRSNELKRIVSVKTDKETKKKTIEKAAVAGPAWYGKNRTLKGYIDIALARHALCVDQKVDTFKGRRCTGCGYVHKTWMPPRYKRAGKRFGLIGVDEIHNVKNPATDQGRAILGMMHAKRRIGMTGTLMPNTPSDAFHPCSWTFGNENHLFKFPRGANGKQDWDGEYTDSVLVESETSSYTKRVPYISKPIQFWEWKAPRTLFRSYGDPRVIESMAKAGLRIPKFRTIPQELVPDPKQGLMLVASIQQFDKLFAEYSNELKKKAKANEKIYLLNSSQVLARMQMMKYAATIPGLLNEKLEAEGKPMVYDGLYGGCKMEHVKNLVAEKTAGNGKVVIFSDMRAMQARLEEELTFYNPIRFQVSWNAEKRAKAFEQFRNDPDRKIFICGQRSVKESIDLSGTDENPVNTCITTDLLWSPGIQMQAWSRLLTPRKVEREVECHILLTKYSIDSHVYSTFYSKIAAAEQALYGRSLTKEDKTFDVKYFVDQILAEKSAILQWLVESGENEMAYMPVLQTLQQLQTPDMVAA